MMLASTLRERCFFRVHQENTSKLWACELQFICKSIWPGGVFYYVLAANGQHAAQNNSMLTRKGGLVNALLPAFATMVSIPSQIHLDGLHFGPLGILKVYGPTLPQNGLLSSIGSLHLFIYPDHGS